MNKTNVSNIARYQLLREFNTRFYNQEFYKDHTVSPFLLAYEENRADSNFLLEDVIDFCLTTEVNKNLGLSLRDLMGCDLPTYEIIKKKVYADLERKSKQFEESRKELELKQKQLQEGDHSGYIASSRNKRR